MFWALLSCGIVALIIVALLIAAAVRSLAGLDPEEWE